MPRPAIERNIGELPKSLYFKPRGIPSHELEEVVLTLGEWEAVRLADWEGFYQEDAAEKMNVSRQTFGNTVASAHKKIAEALVENKALRIEGGESGCRGGHGQEDECPGCGNGHGEGCRHGGGCGNERRKRWSRFGNRSEI